MDDAAATVTRVLGVQAAAASAAIHLIEGVPDLAVYLPILSVRDPRPYLFVPSALLLLGVAAAVLYGARDRRLYSLGAGVMGTYLVGYVWWHLTDHGGLVPAHDVANPVAEIAAHLVADPPALVAFGTELLGVVAFLLLFVADPETGARGRDAAAAPDEPADPSETGDPSADGDA
ncbi:hypothetical protein [Candidatus Halobonum tyrrellensis]|uniref:Uncharacterized protein n=1 Tax=Candidatus Halobonum tyrrellensis G22 TaxID=1324957 RepID=V4HFS5_9EURY|nr:hypothetical protein [Candidatus Halobonum tyrrellensis]ESP89550.1 hypothetical protein K933_03300 [Candidatus Halobonum tyrrellensis G22]